MAANPPTDEGSSSVGSVRGNERVGYNGLEEWIEDDNVRRPNPLFHGYPYPPDESPSSPPPATDTSLPPHTGIRPLQPAASPFTPTPGPRYAGTVFQTDTPRPSGHAGVRQNPLLNPSPLQQGSGSTRPIRRPRERSRFEQMLEEEDRREEESYLSLMGNRPRAPRLPAQSSARQQPKDAAAGKRKRPDDSPAEADPRGPATPQPNAPSIQIAPATTAFPRPPSELRVQGRQYRNVEGVPANANPFAGRERLRHPVHAGDDGRGNAPGGVTRALGPRNPRGINIWHLSQGGLRMRLPGNRRLIPAAGRVHWNELWSNAPPDFVDLRLLGGIELSTEELLTVSENFQL